MKYLTILFITLLTACGTTGEVTPPPIEEAEEQVICGYHPEQYERCCDFDEQCPNGETQFKDCSTHKCNLETRFCEYQTIEDSDGKDCSFSDIKGICLKGICNPQ